MFITEEQARARLDSRDNLANRFNINLNKAIREERLKSNAERCQSWEAARAAEIEESWTEESQSESKLALSAEAHGESEHRSDGVTQHVEERALPRAGRRGPWLPTEKRTEIAIAARTSGLSGGPKETQQEIAERFGISRQGVSQIKAGSGLRDEASVEQALEVARNKALDRLMVSLGLLTDDKISSLDAKEISIVASNMSKVVEKTMPDRDKQANINLVIYSPEIRSEKSFQVVEI